LKINFRGKLKISEIDMKIAVDIRHISKGGIGEYIREIFSRIVCEDIDFFIIALAQQEITDIKALHPEAVNVIQGPKMFSISEQVWLWRFCRKYKPDVYFSPHITFPILSSCPLVLTIHDTIWLNYPQYANGLARLYFLLMLNLAAQRCEKIICISKSTAIDVSKWTGVNTNRLAVIYNGVNLTQGHLTKLHQMHTSYFIYVGSWKPWKRVLDLIAAFELVDVVCTNKEVRPALIIAGKHNYNDSDDVASRVQASAARERIHIVGELNRDELNSLIAGSLALVHPSEYEGFGLTMLEAMALGTPVIATNGGSVPEVVSNAGILVKSRDIKSLSNAMLSIINDATLRNTLVERGKTRALEFSWDKTAKLTLDILLGAAK
jgi:glycosyltransferase involved in cell wall biosynthesis